MWASGAAARVATRGASLMVSIDLRPQAASAILNGPKLSQPGCRQRTLNLAELGWEGAEGVPKGAVQDVQNPLPAPIISMATAG